MTVAPTTWKQLRYHEQQLAAWTSKARYVALPCGRGSGKTELARRRIVRYLPVRKPWANPLYAFVLPTFRQAKRIAWDEIIKLIPREWIKNTNITDLEITTVFGSQLIIAGADQPQRLEGVQYDGVVIDESSDQKPGLFDRTFLPSFAHRGAWCWRIGVPKRYGTGAKEFKEFCESAANVGGSDTDVACYNWPSSDIIPPEEDAAARRRLDPRDYEEQYKARWQSASGAVFYAFDDLANVDETLAEYSPGQTVIVGSDFNVDPMAWILAHKVVYDDGLEGLLVFDEIFLRNTNTQHTLDYLHRRYGNHPSGWLFIGDATGQSRKTSAATSDYNQIRNDARFSNKRVLYPKRNPYVADRFAATNALLCNAVGERRLMIHPRCKQLIADLSARAYKPGSREPNDSGDIGHMTDALGYVCYLLYPPVIKRSETDPAPKIGASAYA